MKKQWIILIVTFITLVLIGCPQFTQQPQEEEVPEPEKDWTTPSSAKIISAENESALYIFVGETLRLYADGMGSAEELSWSSLDESLATVDNSQGVVLGKSEGTVSIMVRNESKGYHASATIEVRNPDFITVWNIPAGGASLNLPFARLSQDLSIDWGDDSAPTIATSKEDTSKFISNDTAEDKEIIVTIRGVADAGGVIPRLDLSTWSFYRENESKDMLIDVTQWGSALLKDSYGAFWGCDSLIKFSALDMPELRGSVDSMFRLTQEFTGEGIEHWNMTKVTKMVGMLLGTPKITADLSNWDVSNVISFVSMFHTSTFNQDLSNWDMTSAIELTYMFYGNNSFDQNMSTWIKWNLDGVISKDMFRAADHMQDTTKHPINCNCGKTH